MDHVTAAQRGANEGNPVCRLRIELKWQHKSRAVQPESWRQIHLLPVESFLHSGRFLSRTGGIYLTVQISLIKHVCVNVRVCIGVCAYACVWVVICMG